MDFAKFVILFIIMTATVLFAFNHYALKNDKPHYQKLLTPKKVKYGHPDLLKIQHDNIVLQNLY